MVKKHFIGPKILVILTYAAACLGVHAGSLEPPAPPAPTSTAMDETDPRIPIRGIDLPLTITAPGSYYLVEDILAFGEGILVSADNVTVDLGGFTLAGSGTGTAIKADLNVNNVTILNGTVTGWLVGIWLRDNTIVRGVNTHDNVGEGIRAGRASVVFDCTASNNGSGISADGGSEVSHSVARNNNSGGINAPGSTVTSCTAYQNAGIGISATTIHDSIANSNFRGITVSSGTVTGCTARDNEETGIYGYSFNSGPRIANNTVLNNNIGILVHDGSFISANNVSGNGIGILVGGSGNRIDLNNATRSDTGIEVTGPGNIIVRNSGHLNSVSYDIAGFNSVGNIVSSPIGAGAWDNFEY